MKSCFLASLSHVASNKGPPENIIYEIRPTFLELNKSTELEKCLYGKTQNASESSNETIWECIPKNNFLTLSDPEFGVYDVAAHFNIEIKASGLVYAKIDLVPGVYMPNGCKKHNLKRVNFGNQRAYSENILS